MSFQNERRNFLKLGARALSTLGAALAAQGYDTAFIYGGDGFFDNMSYFFGMNGYRVVDQPAALKAGRKVSFGVAELVSNFISVTTPRRLRFQLPRKSTYCRNGILLLSPLPKIDCAGSTS